MSLSGRLLPKGLPPRTGLKIRSTLLFVVAPYTLRSRAEITASVEAVCCIRKTLREGEQMPSPLGST